MAQETTASDAPPETPSLWKHRDFLKLWSGFTASAFGNAVTEVAFPLVAIVLLSASEEQLGFLGAIGRVPMLLFLFAGFWADRFRKRPTMIVTDVVRGFALMLIPVLWLTGSLNLVWLGLVSFVLVTMYVFFEVANMSHLPFLVGREQLGDGNAKLQLSTSVGKIAGNTLGSALVTTVSAAVILVIDVVSFFASAVLCALIKKEEPRQDPSEDRPGVISSIKEGLVWVWRQPLVRPGVIASGFYMFFFTGIQVLLPFWITKSLGMEPYWVGVMFAVGAPGAILGSLLAVPVMKRIGMGPGFFWATVVGNGSLILIALATGPFWLALTMIGISQFLLGVTGPIAGVNHTVLRQGATPDRLQGRVMASQRAVALAFAPVGAALAGLLAAGIGVRPTLIICALGALVPVVILALSPVPRTRAMPTPQE
ncbi:MFS transporter [Nonomuraea sp. NPDC050547]|uniref:MFS transporter n=1 Tax=unclassified Nonomuraea TaxID=2593643 RepID=UPI0037AF6548